MPIPHTLAAHYRNMPITRVLLYMVLYFQWALLLPLISTGLPSYLWSWNVECIDIRKKTLSVDSWSTSRKELHYHLYPCWSCSDQGHHRPAKEQTQVASNGSNKVLKLWKLIIIDNIFFMYLIIIAVVLFRYVIGCGSWRQIEWWQPILSPGCFFHILRFKSIFMDRALL